MGDHGNAEGIARLGQVIKQRCLVEGTSLFTESSTWTQRNFDMLTTAYPTAESDGASFDSIVLPALQKVSSGARQLFAELYVIDLLALGNIRAETKITKVDAVLKECEPPMSLARPGMNNRLWQVAKVLRGGGVLEGGQGYNVHRWQQIQFLLGFGRQWTRRPQREREKLMSTPDGIEEAIFGTDVTPDTQMQCALAYILDPEHFSAAIAPGHLQKIADHFSPRYGEGVKAKHLPRLVGEIQRRVREERGEDWDFFVDIDEWNTRDVAPPAETPGDAPQAAEDAAPLDGGEQHVLPRFADDAAESLLVDQEWLDTFHALLARRRQVVLEGPPGTGKTFLARRMARMLAGSKDRVRLVQFHPAYTYEDFFEGFRPTESGALVLRDGPLKTLAASARAEERGAPYFLIIDEMNRGNLARIFGELYFLLEYRDESVQLMYSQDEFTLPSNLYIIATMNSADRSIAVVDAAMRRRFSFVSLDPLREPTKSLLATWCKREQVDPEIAELWSTLNAKIADRDPDAVVGPSYFMRTGIDSPGVLERIWDYEILPQVREAFFGMDDWVEHELALPALREAAATGRHGE